jgi:hypothetical protein
LVKPEDTFEMEGDIGTTKAALTNNTVPDNKFARKVYGMLINNRAGAANTLTLTIERDTTVERTIPPITLGAYDSIDLNRPLDSPIFTMKPGQNIKAVASSVSISVILQAYDL